ncbi:DUF1345 domain-containing protein [Microbacterium sp. NC79]|uniref:DUF1345 domain-containing protein n=1 Tax=Microbacterium sp. NC79 TaxID=2851009 RepID=UPI001C2B8FB4|nr:DUF1345 domain-containing protein [Microbacterium sp. NC79]MBV0894487.1 DUF1345 domain-containing protein [Microbacterium sp. NC79]
MKATARWARLIVGALVGLGVALLTGPWLGLWAGVLAGWAAAAVTVVTWILLVTWPMDGDATRGHATQEDPGRRVARLVSTLGALASLGGVVVVLMERPSSGTGARSVWIAVIVLLAVVSSWFLIQVDSMLRTARMYYTDPVGGIEFHQTEPPAYTDFAYVSFGLGLTYQVADTDVQRTEFRRAFLIQSLIAYLFGAVILATIINLITSLG